MKDIRIQLLSDATFGRGDGVAGLVDDEIDHDPETGLPFIKGRTIKGLLVEECSNILFTIQRASLPLVADMEQSARRLFGSAGSTARDEGLLHFGEARLNGAIRQAIGRALANNPPSLTASEVLDSFTGIRRRSATNEKTEAPADETLRSARVLMRETVFHAPLVELGSLADHDWELLAACTAALRRGGKNRNRGAGRLQCSVMDGSTNLSTTLLSQFHARISSQEVPE